MSSTRDPTNFYYGRVLSCPICRELIWPYRPEENAPANADVKAHRKCCRLDTNDRVPSPGRAPMRWP